MTSDEETYVDGWDKEYADQADYVARKIVDDVDTWYQGNLEHVSLYESEEEQLRDTVILPVLEKFKAAVLAEQAARVAELERENKTLRSKKEIFCSYCGYEISMADPECVEKMSEHIQNCEKHPIARYKERNASLEAEYERIKTVLNETAHEFEELRLDRDRIDSGMIVLGNTIHTKVDLRAAIDAAIEKEGRKPKGAE